jgi:hypothetical protein
MCRWLWTLLPRPLWFRTVSAVILALLTTAVLLFTVFLWLERYVLADSPVMAGP